MPFLRLTAQKNIQEETAQSLARGLTDLMEKGLGKKADLTSVLIQPTDAAWYVGRAAQPVAVHLEVTITQGTNSDQQKADFMRQAMALLKAHFQPLHEATYITIHEMPAASWGYDGLTQSARKKPNPAL